MKQLETLKTYKNMIALETLKAKEKTITAEINGIKSTKVSSPIAEQFSKTLLRMKLSMLRKIKIEILEIELLILANGAEHTI